MESLGRECTELKRKYDACFNTWYSEKFLKGDIQPECEDLFEEYRACIQKVLKERKLNELIEEARQDIQESMSSKKKST